MARMWAKRSKKRDPPGALHAVQQERGRYPYWSRSLIAIRTDSRNETVDGPHDLQPGGKSPYFQKRIVVGYAQGINSNFHGTLDYFTLLLASKTVFRRHAASMVP